MSPSASSLISLLGFATILTFSGPVGWALAWIADRFAGADRVLRPWTAAGALVVAACSVGVCVRAHGSGVDLFLDLLLGWALLLLAVVDIVAFRLPDAITVPLAVAGLALPGPFAPALAERLAGLALGVAALAGIESLYLRLRRRAGIGLGDAKLFGAAGAWLGWRALPQVLVIGCAGGLAWVAVRVLVNGRASMDKPLPFGAPLCVAIWSLWLFRTAAGV